MSDEQGQEQQAETTGNGWGDPISEQRQAELQGFLDRWQAESDHGERKGPFDRAELRVEEQVRRYLTGADVFWLAEQSGRSPNDSMVPNLHLEGAGLFGAHLERASLGQAHLEGAVLIRAYLEGTYLRLAHLEGADLTVAHLEGADLFLAHLEGASLQEAHLEDADLREAHLEGAGLQEVHLVPVQDG